MRSRALVQIAAATLSGNSLRQTVHTHRASVHRAAKLVAVLLRVAGVTAGLAESNGSLPPGSWLTPPAGWLPRTGISYGTLRSIIEYGLPFIIHNSRSFTRGLKPTSSQILFLPLTLFRPRDWLCGLQTAAVSSENALCKPGCSVAEWLACWTRAQKGPGSNRTRDAVG